MAELWEVEEDHAKRVRMKVRGRGGEYKATVKWDGCVEFYRFFNGTTAFEQDDYDHIHICQLDDFIARLQALEAIAKKHFGDDWDG